MTCYDNASNELWKWYLLKSIWQFQQPLFASVWFDFNGRCYWKISSAKFSWKATEVGAKLYFPVEPVTDLIVLGKECLWLQLTILLLLERTSKMNNVSLKQIINRIPLSKYRYFGWFSSHYVPTLNNETFAIINTKPSKMQGEHWIIRANSRHNLFCADSLGRGICSFFRWHYKQLLPVPL